MSDLPPLAAWMASHGFDRLLLLPLGTMQHGQTSPYAATSTLSIDPIYLNLDRVPDFQLAGGVESLSAASRTAIEHARRAPRVEDVAIRAANAHAIWPSTSTSNGGGSTITRCIRRSRVFTAMPPGRSGSRRGATGIGTGSKRSMINWSG